MSAHLEMTQGSEPCTPVVNAMTEPRSDTLLVGLRYRALVEELGREEEYRFGWKAAVARKLGVHPSFVSKVVAGEIRTVSGELVDRARRALDLRAEYFIAPPEQFKGSYRQYIGRGESTAGRPLLWIDEENAALHVRPQWFSIINCVRVMQENDVEGAEASRRTRDLAHEIMNLDLVRFAEALVKETDRHPEATRLLEQKLRENLMGYLTFIQAWDRLRLAAVRGEDTVFVHPSPTARLRESVTARPRGRKKRE